MKNKGFTIVESLIAISILVIVIIGVTKTLQTSLTSFNLSKNQTIAYYLAGEVFEQIRNIRDTNRLSGQTDWLTDLESCIPDNSGVSGRKVCRLDSPTSSVTFCSSVEGNCPVLKQDLNSGLYNYNTGEDSIFNREFEITRISADEINIRVTVYWSKGNINRQITIKENIFNLWQ